jgi:predicted aspartyl protease
MADVGVFRTTIAIEHLSRRGHMHELADILVDTGSALTWIPRSILESLRIEPERAQEFVAADGGTIERDIGYAIVHAGGVATADSVVFAEATDLVRLGWRSLDGLNLRIDVVRNDLFDGGPILAANSGESVTALPERTGKANKLLASLA